MCLGTPTLLAVCDGARTLQRMGEGTRGLAQRVLLGAQALNILNNHPRGCGSDAVRERVLCGRSPTFRCRQSERTPTPV